MTFVQQHDGAIEPTVNAQVFRQIRTDIVTCRLMPNERLRVESLRKRYGVGGSPIREALMRLEAEGLVILEQNKGFRVSPASSEHLLDLMKTRVEIEGLALRWSIEKGGVDWEANLLAAYHRLSHQKKTLRGTGNEVNLVWFREHRNFHSALTAACGSQHLIGIRENLFAQAERYVALSIISKCPAAQRRQRARADDACGARAKHRSRGAADDRPYRAYQRARGEDAGRRGDATDQASARERQGMT